MDHGSWCHRFFLFGTGELEAEDLHCLSALMAIFQTDFDFQCAGKNEHKQSKSWRSSPSAVIPFPPFEVFGMCPWSLCYRRSHSVINGCPVFGYVRADVTVISHHCAKLKPRLHLQVVIMVVTNFGQDCGHLEIVSRYRCKTGLNSALVFWHVIHGQMLQELSEKNMVNSWDFQHLRLLLTLPTFNMDIWKSSLWKRTSCSTSSSSLGFHVKLLNLASFFKHKLDHKWV